VAKEKKEKKKETSAVKYNTSGRYRGRRYKKSKGDLQPHAVVLFDRPYLISY